MGSANLKVFPIISTRVEQLGLILILMPHSSAVGIFTCLLDKVITLAHFV